MKMARRFEPMRTFYAIQRLDGAGWTTTQLFLIRHYAEAKVARLGEGWRVEDVQREILD
jgi:hypothetical protein